MHKKIIKIFIPIIVILVLAGLIKVNMINTKALSIGSSKEAYERIEEEFGEEFAEFIKDKSYIKIFEEDSGDILIRVGENDFRITKESNLLLKAEQIISVAEEFLGQLVD